MTKRGRPRNFDRTTALEKAMVAFWEKGYDNTSMADLITAMNINSPSIYAVFGSKEKLFYEAVLLYTTTEGSRIWDCVVNAPSARTAVESMLRASAEDFTRPHKPRGCLVVLGALHSERGNDAVHHKLQERRKQCLKMLSERLKLGIAEGEFSEGADWRSIARFYITVQQGMSIQAKDGASRKALLEVADWAMAAWEHFVHRELH